ncbi:PIG-L deacetylase family protein [Bosea sp. BH3]|uniref:PIG-L deacetylase family protein n=1 Tax=Bosea sp. BH3 TaxID=2871701 RepID=UPI0021CB2AE4|nr:PIG-L family deacetylase [Bosea sp. BH3]MCU4180128.1 PIG-L family deacetylase [Bosea sp. BH3]
MVTRPLSARSLASSPTASARWLVLAPHADDETLGCGALIADAASRGALAGIVILTDGVGSHSHDGPASRARLVAARRREAARAVRVLAGPAHPPPLFLDWPDARPFGAGEPGFEQARRRLTALCRQRRVDALAVTARHEPHCDHEAAYRLASAVASSAMRPVTVFEYVVWAPEPPDEGYRALRTPPIPIGLRNAALAAHVSQLTPQFGEGFRLPAAKLRMPASDLLYERTGLNARAEKPAP